MIREPAVAGMFYPAGREKLSEEVGALLASAQMEKIPGRAFGIIVPHAGYIYSGRTAAFAYNVLAGSAYSRVVLVGPSHREYFDGVSVYSGDGFRTALGVVPVDREFGDRMVLGSNLLFTGTEGQIHEHCLEVQLPFLQTCLKDFSIVPLIIGNQSRENLYELAERMDFLWDEGTLFVVSSDLSHYHSKSVAAGLDSRVETFLKALDYKGLFESLERNESEACGGGGIVALLRAASLRGFKKLKILSRSDSGDVTGDDSEVVGYLSAVIY